MIDFSFGIGDSVVWCGGGGFGVCVMLRGMGRGADVSSAGRV